ncbi:MAG: hypothetical protein IKN45_06190 [Lachnospiraceae bacterium]|nr:hypothetical protein [Lachnospiraceae bacterium]
MSKTASNKRISSKTIIILSSSAVIRCIFGILSGVWFFPNVYDDLLMFQYSFFGYHFRTPDYCSLVKYISYPVFLFFVKLSHIPYTFWVSLLWCLAALACFYLAGRISSNRYFKYAVYFYVLFLPQAFENWCGTRLYRNAVIGPFVILLFAGMIVILYNTVLQKANRILSFVLLGFLFSFTFYLKEDGIWILACLALWSVTGILLTVKNEKARLRLKGLFYLIPLLVFFLFTLGYKTVNYAAFGVFETNTRTSGSPGEFCELIYRIDSPNRSVYVWAPEDAIDKAFAASPTLSSHPELLEKIKTSPHLNGDIKENPIKGDHLGWVLRIALKDCPEISGGEWDEKKVCDFFDQVNKELKAAFKSGELSKQKNRIQLLHSVGGYTAGEIAGLGNLVLKGFEGAVWLKNYTPGLMDTTNVREIEYYHSAVDDVRDAVHIPSLDTGKAKNTTNAGSSSVLNVITMIIWWIYRVINSALFLLLIAYIIGGAIKLPSWFKKKEENKAVIFKYFCCLCFSVFAFCYALAIAWFSAFLFEEGVDMSILNFYNIALPGLLMFAYCMAGANLGDFLKRFSDKNP